MWIRNFLAGIRSESYPLNQDNHIIGKKSVAFSKEIPGTGMYVPVIKDELDHSKEKIQFLLSKEKSDLVQLFRIRIQTCKKFRIRLDPTGRPDPDPQKRNNRTTFE
jgi:hypothetical protein